MEALPEFSPESPEGEPAIDTKLDDSDIPKGFSFSPAAAGIRKDGHPDVGFAVADRAASAVAMFTSNRVIAAPLILGQRHLAESRNLIRAVIVNSGNANCATGADGVAASADVCAHVGKAIGCSESAVFPSSTGLIGVQLPKQKLISALPALQAGLGRSAAHLERMARAIMTTDTKPKMAAAKFTHKGREARIAGIAKGSGMIAPKLARPRAPHATMLVYLFTDAAASAPAAEEMLDGAVQQTFNRISVDGDTSTNDTVLLWASGDSGVAVEPGRDTAVPFTEALHQVCLSLAKQVVGDGEGAGHLVELEITGAASNSEALDVARAIAYSPLVKTSWAGSDPNWGRILAAVGYSGVFLDPEKVNIKVGGIELCRGGAVSPGLDLDQARRQLEQREFTVHVDLGLGNGVCRFWTTDLTKEYVHINADYST